MPYIVTTKLIAEGMEWEDVETRRTVATLAEVDSAVADEMRRGAGITTGATFADRPEGGTVGPLSDGTLIVVERVDEDVQLESARSDPRGISDGCGTN